MARLAGRDLSIARIRFRSRLLLRLLRRQARERRLTNLLRRGGTSRGRGRWR
jgi:hypothetical protein